MMEIEECLSLSIKELKPKTKTITLPIEQAVGMICAKDVTSQAMVPPFAKSAMDGYAVKAKDIAQASQDHPVMLRVKAQMLAGDDQELVYEEKTAIRIMTGALIPQGYDAVVKQEDTDYGEEQVSVFHSVSAYDNYCKVGEDIKIGDVLCKKGTKILPVHIGLLASAGIREITVIEPVTVAILATGNELTALPAPLTAGKIYNSTSYILKAAIEKEGLRVVQSKICADEKESLSQAMIQAAKQADIVITTGGVSVGKKDLLPEILDEIGAKKIFSRANIQPGTPTIGSVLDHTYILSLSGNPYAALVNFELYFWSVVSFLMQQSSYESQVATAILQSEYPKVNKLRRYIRAYAQNGVVVIPSQTHASSVIANMTACNCFIDVKEGTPLKKGDQVTIRYIK